MAKIVIDSSKKFKGLGVRELLASRDLFYTLAWRDFKIRYSQTFIGVLWGVIQPALQVTVLWMVFSHFVGIQTGSTPYLAFLLTGLSPWAFFSFVVTNSGNSIIGAQNMVKKVYFPRLVIPLSKAALGLIDFLIYLLILTVILIFYRYTPPPQVIFLPLFILLNIIAALSVGIWLSALSIRYRDFQFIIPIMVQLGFYITPVIYPADKVVTKLPAWASYLYFLNPMAGIIQGFRWCLLGATPPGLYSFISFGIIALIFTSGVLYFRKVESVMSDII